MPHEKAAADREVADEKSSRLAAAALAASACLPVLRRPMHRRRSIRASRSICSSISRRAARPTPRRVLVARHLGTHIPGNPAILARNMGGAGGLIGSNYVGEVAPPDGLTLGYFSGIGSKAMMKDPACGFQSTNMPSSPRCPASASAISAADVAARPQSAGRYHEGRRISGSAASRRTTARISASAWSSISSACTTIIFPAIKARQKHGSRCSRTRSRCSRNRCRHIVRRSNRLRQDRPGDPALVRSARQRRKLLLFARCQRHSGAPLRSVPETGQRQTAEERNVGRLSPAQCGRHLLLAHSLDAAGNAAGRTSRSSKKLSPIWRTTPITRRMR